jgi:hypothetical protein
MSNIKQKRYFKKRSLYFYLAVLASSVLATLFTISAQASADSISGGLGNLYEYPNSTTSDVGQPSGSNSDSSTGVLAEVGAQSTGSNSEFYLFGTNGTSEVRETNNPTSQPAQRPEGLYNYYSDFEVIAPTAQIDGGQGNVYVHFVDACKLLNDNNGWEDHGIDSIIGSLRGGVGQVSNTGSIVQGISYNGSCNSGDMVVDVPSGDFSTDYRYGTAYSSAIVELYDSNPNQGKKYFSVFASQSAGSKTPYTGVDVTPTSDSPYPYSTAAGGTYGSSSPGAYGLASLSNPSSNYYYQPAGACSGSAVANCGGMSSLNIPDNSDLPQTSVYDTSGNAKCNTTGTLGSSNSCATSASVNNFNFYFSPDCTYTNGESVYLKWERMQGSGTQLDTTGQHAEGWALKDVTTGGNTIDSFSYANANDTYQSSAAIKNMVMGDVYEWSWSNVDSDHGVSVWLPFSEFTATSGYDPSVCNYSLTSHTTVDQSSIVAGQDATFSSWIHNNGPGNATDFNWQIQGNYRDSNGTSSGWSDAHCGNDPYDNTPGFKSIQSQTGPPSSCPTLSGDTGDNLSYNINDDDVCGDKGNMNCKNETYTFPSSAIPGDQYCIRITYTDQSGSSSPTDTGSCVTFKALSGLSGFCDYALFNTGSPYGTDATVRYALFEAPTGAIPAYTTGEEVPGATAKSFPNLATGSINSNDSAAPNSNHSYYLTPTQISSGNVSWYLITYNDATINKVDYAYIDSVHSATETGCNSATCSVNIQNTGPVSQYGLGDVVGNQAFSYTVTIFNTGNNTLENPLTTQAPTYSLSGTSNITNSATGGVYQANTAHPISGPIPAGGSATTPAIGVTAPYDTQAYTITAYPDYYGKGPIGTPCTTTFDDFENFNITGSDSVSYVNQQGQPTDEDPYQANMIFQAENTDPFPATSTMTMELYHVAAGQPDYTGPPAYGPNPVTAVYGSNIYNPTTLLTGWNAGDSYCSYMTINAATGYVGPGGVEIPTGSANFPGNCPLIQNEPYVHVLGNDAVAGGGFGDNCNVSTGGIYTFSHASAAAGADGDTKPTGSGSQFGAEAYSIIEGLSSANLKASPPNGPMGLTFANSVNGSGSGTAGSDAANLGGSFGTGNCVPDYASAINSDTTEYSPSATMATSKTYTEGTGSGSTTTIGSGSTAPVTVSPGVNSTIYVNGNIYIDSNIIYADSTTGWASIADIPSLYVIASGNIYIAPTVTRLDGVYVAEAKNGSGGTLDTCANVLGSFSSPDLLYGDTEGCNTQLVINGAVVANHVDLDRSFSSLRYALAGEDINTPGAATHACGTLGQEVNSGYASTSEIDCAAEIFNFSPELYLSTPDLKPVTGPTTGKFDDITSLSPVL